MTKVVRVERNGLPVPCPVHRARELLQVVEGPNAGKAGCERCLGRVEVDETRTVDAETGEVIRRLE